MAIAPLFNAYWYTQQNPDVAQAVSAGLIDARTHFELFGRQEGREASALFNVATYLEDNPDVAAAVAAGQMNAYEHFERWGWEEDRSPLRLFDEALYLAHNPDVQTVVQSGQMTAVQHLLNFGVSEGRLLNVVVHLGQYMNANPDVPPAVQSGDISALEHLIMFGTREARDLGNGVSLGQFSNDPVFQQALESGNVTQALSRVADVAPFIPTFQRPEGWVPNPDHVIPVDFIPPPGLRLVVPDDITLPPGLVLPGNVFQPPGHGPAPGPGPAPHPDPWTLTTGIDSLTGTGGDDTFYGMLDTTADSTSSTLTTGDSISGGDGNDTFWLQVQGSGDVSPSPSAVSLAGVETIVVASDVAPAKLFSFAPYSIFQHTDNLELLHLQVKGLSSTRPQQLLHVDMAGTPLTSIVLENARDVTPLYQSGSGRANFSLANLATDSEVTLLANSGVFRNETPSPNTSASDVLLEAKALDNNAPTRVNLQLGATGSDAPITVGQLRTTNVSSLYISHETAASVSVQVMNYQENVDLDIFLTGGHAGQEFNIGDMGAARLDATDLASNLIMEIVGTVQPSTVTGGSGNDIFTVLPGDKAQAASIDGGAGNDKLEGASANDILTGGEGSDTFMFKAGQFDYSRSFLAEYVAASNGTDEITDFSTEDNDVLAILHILATTAPALVLGKWQSSAMPDDPIAANVLVITDEQANGGVDLTATEVDALAAKGSSIITPGFILLNNNGTTQLWYDEKIGQANGAQDIALLATLTGFTDLDSLDSTNFV